MSLISDEEWVEYKSKFDKSYEAEEDQMRRELYAKSKARIDEHNQKFEKGEVTWKMGINHLADLTPEEFAQRCGKKPPN
ncbi:protein CTLA-2-beta [Drosophila subpulchrella]|uniref:protein CTLA-2-beta n=1 Tax=Drosophila subpulchrella TaxID=1486046 RepID=UPI0018A185B1|nr:protein CTLA-2-beta [Drosophila subpulchrella]